MAIDLRQEQQQRQRPATPPRRRGTVWMVAAALVAVFAVGAVMTVVTLRDVPAPAGEISTLPYPEGASTAGREGGVYVVVPQATVGFTDTAVGSREGGSYATTWDPQKLEAYEGRLTAGYTDTSVQIREGASSLTTWDPQKLEAYEGRLTAG